MVDDTNWGLGVFNGDCVEFHGGLHGKAGKDEPLGGPTTYIAPISLDVIDHNIIYNYAVTLMVGDLTAMRVHFNTIAKRSLPSWQFTSDRQHWHVEHAHDGGFPLVGNWVIQTNKRSARLVSQLRCWDAQAAPSVTIRASWSGDDGAIAVR